MRGFKFRFYVIMILATLSLVSVGFASWIATETIYESSTGLIIVDDVLKVNDFITCSSEDITEFSFFKTGFVDEEGNISTSGKIASLLTINLDACENEFKDCDSIEVQFSMLQEKLSLFNDAVNISYTASVMQGENEISSVTTSNANLCVTTFEIPLSGGVIQVLITYTFTIENVDYYKTNIYPLLLKDDFNFTLSAKLTGKKVTS